MERDLSQHITMQCRLNTLTPKFISIKEKKITQVLVLSRW